MSDRTITSPKKSPFTLGLLGVVVLGAIGAHFVANYGRYLPHRWQTYTAPDGSFSIQLPGKPSIEPTKIPLEGGGTADVNMITATPTDHTSYVFTYVEREKVGQQSPDQALAGARDGALRKVQGTLLTQKTITVQGYPGLDVHARARGNSFVDLRFVVVGNRLFMIMAVATVEGDREPKAIQRMLDSFKMRHK